LGTLEKETLQSARFSVHSHFRKESAWDLRVHRAAIAIRIRYLEAVAAYDLGTADTFIHYLYPAYVRGLAYLRARRGIAAATEFQKVLDHKSIVQNLVTGSLTQVEIGRAYAIAGDTPKARAAYQGFFNLWKRLTPTFLS